MNVAWKTSVIQLVLLFHRVSPTLAFGMVPSSKCINGNFKSRIGHGKYHFSCLHAVIASKPIDPSDPYANLLRNYQKKGQPMIEDSPSPQQSSSISSVNERIPPLPSSVPSTDLPISGAANSDGDSPATNMAQQLGDLFQKNLNSVRETAAPPDNSQQLIDSVREAVTNNDASYSTDTTSPLGDLAQKNLDVIKESAASQSQSLPDLNAVTESIKNTASSAASNAATSTKPLQEFVRKSLESLKLSMPSGEIGEPLRSIPMMQDGTLANAQQKVSLIIRNLLNAPQYLPIRVDFDGLPLPESTKVAVGTLSENAKPAVQAISAIGAALKNTRSSPGDVGVDGALSSGATSFNELISNLNFNQNGPWYVAGLAVILALVQRNGGMEEARMSYEREIEKLKLHADEAADAADVAAQGAKKAKNLARTSAASTFAAKTEMLRQIQAESEIMRKEMERIRSENHKLKAQLENNAASIPPASPKSATPFFAERPAAENEHNREEKSAGKINARIDSVMMKIEETGNKPANTSPVAKKSAPAKIQEEETLTASKSRKKKAAKVKKAIKQEIAPLPEPEPVYVAVTSRAVEAHPWSSLSSSSLGRKTVAELSSFLEERWLPNAFVAIASNVLEIRFASSPLELLQTWTIGGTDN